MDWLINETVSVVHDILQYNKHIFISVVHRWQLGDTWVTLIPIFWLQIFTGKTKESVMTPKCPRWVCYIFSIFKQTINNDVAKKNSLEQIQFNNAHIVYSKHRPGSIFIRVMRISGLRYVYLPNNYCKFV